MLNINTKVWILADDWVKCRMHTGVNISCVYPPVIQLSSQTQYLRIILLSLRVEKQQKQQPNILCQEIRIRLLPILKNTFT